MKKFVKKPHVTAAKSTPKCRLRVGDRVQVISGVHQGALGEIESLDLTQQRVVVKNVNPKMKHQKPSSQNPKGGIRMIYAPLALSNVAFYDGDHNKVTRIGYRMEEGKKQRYSKLSGKTITKKIHRDGEAT